MGIGKHAITGFPTDEAKERLMIEAAQEAHGPFQPMPSTVYLYVNDVDSRHRQAITEGAISLSEPADQPYGDRGAGVTDPFGNVWYIASHIAKA